MSSSEQDLLRVLDRLCYADAESGGEGWATISAIAPEFFAGENWTGQVLNALRVRDLVERRRRTGDRALEFAPTEAGAQLLHAFDSAQPQHPISGGDERG